MVRDVTRIYTDSKELLGDKIIASPGATVVSPNTNYGQTFSAYTKIEASSAKQPQGFEVRVPASKKISGRDDRREIELVGVAIEWVRQRSARGRIFYEPVVWADDVRYK